MRKFEDTNEEGTAYTDEEGNTRTMKKVTHVLSLNAFVINMSYFI